MKYLCLVLTFLTFGFSAVQAQNKIVPVAEAQPEMVNVLEVK